MRTLFKIVLVLLLLYVCAILGEFFAGVVGAMAAAFFHAAPYATTVIVRVLAAVFFFCFVLSTWVIYSRSRARRSQRQKTVQAARARRYAKNR